MCQLTCAHVPEFYMQCKQVKCWDFFTSSVVVFVFRVQTLFFFFCPFTFPHFHSNIFQSLFRNLLTFVSLYINCMICIPYTVTWLLFCYWKTQKLQQKVARNADGRLRHRLYCRSLQLLCSNDIEFLPNKAEVCIDTDQRSFLTVVGIWDFIRKQTWTE